jgi:TRAP-type C4-dicarboxylate transport system substrate-binding protein
MAEEAQTSVAHQSLLLAYPPGFADAQIGLFQEMLAQESGGSVDVAVSDEFPLDTRTAEQDIVSAVAAGELDLGWIGARAFSELGVHDFDALLAPLLIDSLATQKAVLADELSARMLAGIEPLEVTGLALIAGPLRRPISVGPPLTSLDRFAGLSFQAFPGDVSSASVAALGAVEAQIPPARRDQALMDGSLLAYENSLALMANNLDTPARTMALNVNLWPAVGVIIANPDTLAALSPQQRDAVTAAAAATADRAFDALEPESQLVAVVCAQKGSFGYATPEALAQMRAAVEPVYGSLRANPATAAAIEEIERIKGSTPAEDVAVPPTCRVE